MATRFFKKHVDKSIAHIIWAESILLYIFQDSAKNLTTQIECQLKFKAKNGLKFETYSLQENYSVLQTVNSFVIVVLINTMGIWRRGPKAAFFKAIIEYSWSWIADVPAMILKDGLTNYINVH